MTARRRDEEAQVEDALRREVEDAVADEPPIVERTPLANSAFRTALAALRRIQWGGGDR